MCLSVCLCLRVLLEAEGFSFWVVLKGNQKRAEIHIFVGAVWVDIDLRGGGSGFVWVDTYHASLYPSSWNHGP